MWKYNHYDEMLNSSDSLMHYGIKGMKWGVRRKRNTLPRVERRKTKQLNKSRKEWDKEYRKVAHEIHNDAAKEATEKLVPAINKKYAKYDFTNLRDPKTKRVYDQYLDEYNQAFKQIYQRKLEERMGRRPE